ncbi:MAG TPA: TRAP transporter small permease [Ramlibacter sp.]|uniref:TRAP transporter small permease n=1 Tax=Ramlibacter sp. TaxID=1917967 RepID=UPI002CB7EEBF|nr:TRAP transporter small permease [Ramlibacter sp.]HVZ42801.1 TRAP transporter small permease [Ramlibacter sp.]
MRLSEIAERGNAMLRFRDRYGRVLEWVVIALMVALTLEVMLGVVFRALGRSLVWYDEVASVLLAWLTFYGSALASVKRAHIGCPEVADRLPPAARRWLAVLAQLLVIAFFALLGYVGLTIMPVLEGDTLVSLPWVPMNFVQSAVPVSSGLILVAEAIELADLLVGSRAPLTAADATALADGLH